VERSIACSIVLPASCPLLNLYILVATLFAMMANLAFLVKVARTSFIAKPVIEPK
jgi:hypothetical protein